MSDSQDKSIAGGISIPNWMKQKIGDRYDLDDAAFSPPSQDDSFFYIRYPKTTSRPQSETNYHRINQYLEGTTAAEQKPSSSSSTMNPKPLVEQAPIPKLVMPELPLEVDPDNPPKNLGHRRGSKSLPASPLTTPDSSPRIPRKGLTASQHKYFTAAFQAADQEKPTQSYSGWLLGGLLGPRENAIAQADQLESIVESPAGSPDVAAGLAVPANPGLAVPSSGEPLRKSMSAAMLGSLKEDDNPTIVMPTDVKKVKVIKPKPSELREMNFWSPTSM